MTELTRNDLELMEGRILLAIDKRFEQHELLEMVIYKNVQKVIDRHDEFLIGPDGNGGIKEDVGDIEKKLVSISTKMTVWSGVFSLVLGGSGLTVLYMIITTP